MPLHERRCFDCGCHAMHEDNVAPEVCCKNCGSQDTRAKKPDPLSPVERAKSLLMKAAGEMVRGEGMPSEFLEDWKLPKATPKVVKQDIVTRSMNARSKAIWWAKRVREAIEILGSA